MDESTLERTMRLMRAEWQASILKDFRSAVIAELDGETRDAMLRQVSDIAKQHGLVV